MNNPNNKPLPWTERYTKLLRKNIRTLQPYSCARDEFQGEASVFLDANESPYNIPFNRYPDPLQQTLKTEIAELKKVNTTQIFLGNGSDEAIDLVFRAFCEPRTDNVVAMEPTYGMYKVCANINDVEYRPVMPQERFRFRADDLLAASDEQTKVIWLCSPNNPTGNSVDRNEIFSLLQRFHGMVVVDEAYIDFSPEESLLNWLNDYPNLIVLQTLSKAWASAAIRLGMAFADEQVIAVFNKIKYPYNINLLTQNYALTTLRQPEQTRKRVRTTLDERRKMAHRLTRLPMVRRVYPSDANFLLVEMDDAEGIYRRLAAEGIVVRNRHSVALCAGCLRITIGTPEENEALIRALAAQATH